MKSYINVSAAIGQSLQTHESISYVLHGLDSSYDAMVTSIMTHLYISSREDLYGQILNFELHLVQHISASEATLGCVNMETVNDTSKSNGSTHQPSQHRISQGTRQYLMEEAVAVVGKAKVTLLPPIHNQSILNHVINFKCY
ncbi:hypothetical protein Nepgr_007883 [Nepenthes gracilis]|uniref:Uncharacterized protein n=1 Tax=Nepenthes gracilis TaxID=150966 RepID=A0AAD3XIQ5_NEPGR|nr:hypothetical protein Nepgr_007883 [Nepenthes gracilis]